MREKTHAAIVGGLAALVLTVLPAFGQSAVSNGDPSAQHVKKKVPEHVILVKGAWSSTNDSTPVPEGGTVNHDVYRNQYFGISYPLPPDWVQKYSGPPPSDTGSYVLAQLSRPDSYQGNGRGNILITAQDMFFTPLPVANAWQMVNYTKDRLPSDYQLEPNPLELQNGGMSFASFAYWSPVAQLHWYVLATEIRCHTVEFVFMNRDPVTLGNIVRQMSILKLSKEGGASEATGGDGVPVCIKDYASNGAIIERLSPVFSQPRFNLVPVRIIIDKRGRVKHIHFLSAFPDQRQAIGDALSQWRFKPYLRNGQPVEVETGIMFGPAPHPMAPAKRAELRHDLARRSP
jgi:Gram-negative bacterial TonB protein C-terminal